MSRSTALRSRGSSNMRGWAGDSSNWERNTGLHASPDSQSGIPLPLHHPFPVPGVHMCSVIESLGDRRKGDMHETSGLHHLWQNPWQCLHHLH